MPRPFRIRQGRAEDGPALARVYWRAGALFAHGPHPEAAPGLPPPAAPFARTAARGRILTAEAGAGMPIGFLAHLPAALTDGTAALHIGELDVDPAWMGRGVGSALIAALEEMARAQGRGALTLTTYRDIAWNAPFYRRRGFAAIPAGDWPAVCRGERDRMRALGLPVADRVAMLRRL